MPKGYVTIERLSRLINGAGARKSAKDWKGILARIGGGKPLSEANVIAAVMADDPSQPPLSLFPPEPETVQSMTKGKGKPV